MNNPAGTIAQIQKILQALLESDCGKLLKTERSLVLKRFNRHRPLGTILFVTKKMGAEAPLCY